jgi:hypothetical protein
VCDILFKIATAPLEHFRGPPISGLIHSFLLVRFYNDCDLLSGGYIWGANDANAIILRLRPRSGLRWYNRHLETVRIPKFLVQIYFRGSFRAIICFIGEHEIRRRGIELHVHWVTGDSVCVGSGEGFHFLKLKSPIIVVQRL